MTPLLQNNVYAVFVLKADFFLFRYKESVRNHKHAGYEGYHRRPVTFEGQ